MDAAETAHVDEELPADFDEEPVALRHYRELVAALSDRSSVTDEAFDRLAPGEDAAEQGIWVRVVVASRVVPEV